MMNLIQRYKELYLVLQKNGRQLSPRERKLLIIQMIRIEKAIIKKLEVEIIHGNLVIDISQLPPRLKKIIQAFISQKYNIIRTLELERIANLKKYNESFHTINRLSQVNLFSQKRLEQNSISYLVKLQRTEDENTKHSSKIIKKTLEKTKPYYKL